MNPREKSLYHQIHPLKLFTDWGTGIVALYPLWQHEMLFAALIAFVPSIVVSILLIRYANLERLRDSAFGRYLKRYMTGPLELLRFVGYGVMAGGAWYHIVALIFFGLAVIVLAWLRGVLLPGRA